MLNDLKAALESVDPNVFYGMATSGDGLDIWDYIVFSRYTLRTDQNATGYTDRYQVAIVRENYIPDEDVYAVIDAVLSIPGMRLSQNDFAYDYTAKPNTNTVCELLVLEFDRPRKRQRVG